MKKLFIAIAAVALVFATSCKKENINEPVNPEDIPANSFLCEIDQNANPQNAPAVDDGMGTMAHFNGNGIFWQAGDVIKVNSDEFTCDADLLNNNRAYFVNNTYATTGFQDAPYYAVYPAGIVTNINKGSVEPQKNPQATLTLPNQIEYNTERTAEQFPMVATNATNHWLSFQNICAALKITVPVACDKIVISVNEKISGAATYDFTTNTLAISSDGTTYNSIEIKNETADGNHAAGFAQGEVVYVAIPAGTYNDFYFELFVEDENSTEANPIFNSIYQTPGREITVNVNKIYPVDITVPDPLLQGVFSVSATKQVQFTRGNLYWNGNNWHMEANQAAYPTTWNPKHVGHFYFAETAAVAYGTSAPTSGTGTSYLFCDKNHSMTVEGESGLYVLSSAEWQYILNNYTNKAFNNIDGTLCLLIANNSSTNLTDISTVANIPGNVLCLPVAGLRSVVSGSTVITFNSKRPSGWYLTSSLSTTSGYDCLYFQNGYEDVFTESSFLNATPVRLVKTYTGN